MTDEREEIDGRLEAAEQSAKVRSMPPEARLMYLASIVYAVRMHTNGFIPHDFAGWYEAGFRFIDEDPRTLAERIVARAAAAATQHSQDGGHNHQPS